MEQVVLLNSDYTFLNTISWKRAMVLLCKEKVEVIKSTSRVIEGAEKKWEIFVPKVIRLVKLVRTVYKNKVPYSHKNIFIRDKYICQYCGKKFKKLTIDHVIPKSKGGKKRSFENCVSSCFECNNKKRDRSPREARMKLLKHPKHPTIIEFIFLKMKNDGIEDILKELFNE